MGLLEACNRSLFLAINGGEGTPVWLIATARGMAEYLIDLIPILLLSLWLWGAQGHRRAAIKACVVALVAVAANQAIAAIWPHPRPFALGIGHVWMAHAPDSSFPSDHMTVFSGVGMALASEGMMAWGFGILLVGFVVAWSRIFLGVHFPLDMVGALAVGMIATAAMTPPWRAVGFRVTSGLERWYRWVLARPIAAGWVRA